MAAAGVLKSIPLKELVQWLQYKKIGKFADYLVGERTYITFSFIAKSALAWQIFAGVLATSTL